jgi:SnoaL-like protein
MLDTLGDLVSHRVRGPFIPNAPQVLWPITCVMSSKLYSYGMGTGNLVAAEDRFLAVWNTYQAAWSGVSGSERQRMLDESVAPDCVYTDPTSVSRGHRELTAKMQATQRNFPGAMFRNDKFVQHHGQAISNWTMLDGNGTAIFTGTSYARYGDDGRLAQMTGFFEAVR